MTPTFEEVPIATVREYWNRRPCNLRHSPAPVGTRQYFDEVEQRKYVVEPHIPAFADFARWKDRRERDGLRDRSGDTSACVGFGRIDRA